MTQDSGGFPPKPFSLGSGYELNSLLGHGVVGSTWRGTGPNNAQLSITVLNEHFAANEQIVRHLIAQRFMLSAVHDEHIVPMTDLIAEKDLVAVISPYVPGIDLRSLLDEEGTLRPATACRIVSEAASGLAVLHGLGLTHRDFKPSNILLDSSREPWLTKITDYAVASVVEEWATEGPMAVLASTPQYLSPEVIAGDPATVQSDIYALGVVLYEALAGVTPFAPLEPEGTMQAILTLDPGRPEGLDDGLWEVLKTLLSRNPSERGSADAIAWRLSELQNALVDAPKLPKLEYAPAPTPLPRIMAFPGTAPTGMSSGSDHAFDDDTMMQTGADDQLAVDEYQDSQPAEPAKQAEPQPAPQSSQDDVALNQPEPAASAERSAADQIVAEPHLAAAETQPLAEVPSAVKQAARKRSKFLLTLGVVLVVVLAIVAGVTIALALHKNLRSDKDPASGEPSPSAVATSEPSPTPTPTPSATPSFSPTPEVWPPEPNAVICNPAGTTAVKRGTTYCTLGTEIVQALASGSLVATPQGQPAVPPVMLKINQVARPIAVTCTAGATITTCTGDNGSVVWLRK